MSRQNGYGRKSFRNRVSVASWREKAPKTGVDDASWEEKALPTAVGAAFPVFPTIYILIYMCNTNQKYWKEVFW